MSHCSSWEFGLLGPTAFTMTGQTQDCWLVTPKFYRVTPKRTLLARHVILRSSKSSWLIFVADAITNYTVNPSIATTEELAETRQLLNSMGLKVCLCRASLVLSLSS